MKSSPYPLINLNAIKQYVNFTPRFAFWKVILTVFAIYLLFAALALLAIMLAPIPEEEKAFGNMFSGPHLSGQIISFCFKACYFFFAVNIFYHLMQIKAHAWSYVKTVTVFIFVFFIYYFVTNNFSSVPKLTNDKMPLAFKVVSYSMGTAAYIGLSMLIAYLSFLRDEKKQQKVLEEQKQLLEVEKSTANLNFLKAQINPHFLHNTLNFLYAKSLPYSTELSDGILTLSKVMRYALEEATEVNGTALLKDEIEHVRNVIKINQMRFSNNLKVQFKVEGVANGIRIIPFVLITLVENAFKHGDLKDPDQPIDIRLTIDQHSLYFCCKNKKKEGPKELSTGIGLNNIRKRLDLTYGLDYNLTITDESHFYTIQLTIARL